MKVLELFAWSRSIGKAAEELWYEVFSSDLLDFPDIDYKVDILEFDYKQVPFIPDMIWCSPPCTGFSVAAIWKNWVSWEEFTPKTDSARLWIKLLLKTIEVIEYYKKLNPNLIWYIENPRGKMRKAPFLQDYWIRHTVTYCQYWDDRMKPTDLWTNNKNWIPKPMCKNGMPCHVAAPRGSQTWTQGKANAYERSKIPHDLCKEVLTQF